LGGFVFIFQGTLRTAFQSIIFILFTHPFDADDLIVIDDHYYVVHELGLWVSSYITQGGHMVYIANNTLVNKPIINLRRSPTMTEMITISVLPTVTKDKIKALEIKLLEFLKAN